MVDTPPVFKTPQSSKRYDDLKTAFKTRYGELPDFYVRAPGRVNLIGEHIDYCGYAVLPMAIEQDIVIAARKTTSDKLRLSNTDNKYEDFECATDSVIIHNDPPTWYNYFLCGVKGIMEHLKLQSCIGMDCMVDGTIPASSGLSSSSALVCCSALTLVHASGNSISKNVIADLCANCEQYIGTQGGGMDQAISFMAQSGTAKLIEFNPLKSTDVKLPDGAVFIISNSCVEMNKAASSYFNVRVVECRLAAQLLAKDGGLNWKEFKKLGDVQKALGVNLEDMLTKVDNVLHPEPYSKDEICDILGVNADELAQTTLTENTLTVQSFKLHDRATHVYGEATRVYQFKNCCDDPPADSLEKLGELMNASHASCRDLYECSCPDLDNLVDICMKAGALGSRLTGAGWGGCAVSLVPACYVETFLQKVANQFYSVDERRKEKQKVSLFSTQPGGGACIMKAGALGSMMTGAGWGGCLVSIVKASHVQTFLQKVADTFYSVDKHRKEKEKDSLFVAQPGGGAYIMCD